MLKQVAIVGALFASLWSQSLRADDAQALRNDAIALMGPAVYVPGTAAYCNKTVAPNQRLIDAAGAWNRRHDALLRKMVQVVEATGGLSAAERKSFQSLAFQAIRQDVDGQADKRAFCDGFATDLDAGKYDIESGGLADAAKHVLAAELN